MTNQFKLPITFWIIAVSAILWNLFGVASFAGHAFAPEAAFAELTPDQKTYMEGFPAWAFVVFGTAVTTGLLGSIGLVLKKKWASLLFLISLITVLINQLHPLLFTNYMEIFGGTSTLYLPSAIILVALLLWYYSKRCDAKGWLT